MPPVIRLPVSLVLTFAWLLGIGVAGACWLTFSPPRCLAASPLPETAIQPMFSPSAGGLR
jgi:hypothetical protein